MEAFRKANVKNRPRQIIWFATATLLVFGALTYPLKLDMVCHGNVDYWDREVKVFLLPNGSTPDCMHPQGIGNIIDFYMGQDRYFLR